MFLAPLFLVLAADTLTVDLDAWVPRRMVEVHVTAVAVAVTSQGEHRRTWSAGVENVFTRKRVSDGTAWPVRGFGSPQSRTASPHARIGAVLPPGLIAVGVLAALSWLLLIPLSVVLRRAWRFGRWHEVLAICIAVPVTWLFLRRVSGTVLASYFTAIATGVTLVPVLLGAAAWRRSRLAALVPLLAAGVLVAVVRDLVVPLPSRIEGNSAIGATLDELESLATRALDADSTTRASLAFRFDGDRWIARDRNRGAEAILVLLPQRDLSVVAVSNTGRSSALLQEIVDSIAR